MKSLKELYKIGRGPSSSHTMGPEKASKIFLDHVQNPERFEVTLYGSLAATGKGHLTDIAISDVLSPVAPVEILWESKTVLPFHTNGMRFRAFLQNGETLDWTVYSVGGGSLAEDPANTRHWTDTAPDIYDLNTLTDIKQWCYENGCTYWEYVAKCEDESIRPYLHEIWNAMKQSVRNGLEKEGVLPGPLHLQRKAANYFVKASGYKSNLQSRGLVYAYALAVSEENATGGTLVTAPTCGSSGVMPAVLYHLQNSHGFTDAQVVRALATAGIFGNVVKQNASISGAEVGCQGEVGVACAMAAAASCQLFGGSISQIEYAAEMGLEHHLGMTCDPICGIVQIPCIERNAFGAARALDAELYALFSDGSHRISFDRVVRVMKKTGHDIPSLYKETSEGGLAAEL